jgi:hypothetical protein
MARAISPATVVTLDHKRAIDPAVLRCRRNFSPTPSMFSLEGVGRLNHRAVESSQQLAQYKRQDAAVAVVIHFDGGIDAAA